MAELREERQNGFKCQDEEQQLHRQPLVNSLVPFTWPLSPFSGAVYHTLLPVCDIDHRLCPVLSCLFLSFEFL